MISKYTVHAAATAIVAGVALGLSSSAPEGVSVGDQVSYSFRTPAFNAMGAKSLSDMRGKPMLVEFWGTR
ncbi:MAG: hypothetical protein ABGY71_14360 [bacterium]|jgi:hypothetical protein|nr:hypothetical protein [Planctomycetota bacterium]HIL52518.1 hypothetical protein [Planctomycetota bacterium]